MLKQRRKEAQKFSCPGIYAITNLENNRIYIGIAVNLWARWLSHIRLLKRGKHTVKPLQCDWDHFGVSAFVGEVLEYLPLEPYDFGLAREVLWIRTFLYAGVPLYNNAIPGVAIGPYRAGPRPWDIYEDAVIESSRLNLSQGKEVKLSI